MWSVAIGVFSLAGEFGVDEIVERHKFSSNHVDMNDLVGAILIGLKD
jgi:hypothetical protein